MDYYTQLWVPQEGPYLVKIETIIYNFTKMIPEIRNLDYPEELSWLRLQSAQRRYERYSVIYSRKCICGFVPIIGISIRREDLSRNGTTLEVPITKDMSYMRRNSFLIRGPELFNSLPAHIRDQSIWQETFKKRLDESL